MHKSLSNKLNKLYSLTEQIKANDFEQLDSETKLQVLHTYTKVATETVVRLKAEIVADRILNKPVNIEYYRLLKELLK